MKKYTTEEVKQYLAKEGYTLISPEYKSNNLPIKMLCPNNHLYITTFSHFKNGNGRCQRCQGKTIMYEEEAIEWFRERGSELIGEFRGVRSIVTYKCKCGEICTKKMKNLLLNEILECDLCRIKRLKEERDKDFEDLLRKIDF